MNVCLFIAKPSFLYNDLLRARRPSGAMKHEVFFSSGLNIGFLSKKGVMEKGLSGQNQRGRSRKKVEGCTTVQGAV